MLAIAFVGYCYIHTQRRFSETGVSCDEKGAAIAFSYVELFEGHVRSLDIGGEMLIGAPHVVHLPPASVWARYCARLGLVIGALKSCSVFNRSSVR